MGRNYFSRHGGPYFINDGVSRHDHSHKPGEHHEDSKQNNGFILFVSLGLLAIVLHIAVILTIAF